VMRDKIWYAWEWIHEQASDLIPKKRDALYIGLVVGFLSGYPL